MIRGTRGQSAGTGESLLTPAKHQRASARASAADAPTLFTPLGLWPRRRWSADASWATARRDGLGVEKRNLACCHRISVPSFLSQESIGKYVGSRASRPWGILTSLTASL